jgi:hypothetical protein
MIFIVFGDFPELSAGIIENGGRLVNAEDAIRP